MENMPLTIFTLIMAIFFFIFAEKREFQLQSGIATISRANNPSIIRRGKPLFRDFEAFQRQIQPYAKKPIFATS